MAYSSESDIRAATGFSNVTNITSAQIVAIIADADDIIDSSIGDVYTLPLDSTPQLIETISRHISIGLLYANEYGEETENLDKGWEKRLKFWMDILKEIQDQTKKLLDSSGDELARSGLRSPEFYPTAAASAAGESAEPNFTMKTVY